jgi:hypothetical protein
MPYHFVTRMQPETPKSMFIGPEPLQTPSDSHSSGAIGAWLPSGHIALHTPPCLGSCIGESSIGTPISTWQSVDTAQHPIFSLSMFPAPPLFSNAAFASDSASPLSAGLRTATYCTGSQSIYYHLSPPVSTESQASTDNHGSCIFGREDRTCTRCCTNRAQVRGTGSSLSHTFSRRISVCSHALQTRLVTSCSL